MAAHSDRYPLISDLRTRASRRLPSFAWAYLDSATGDERAMHRNEEALAEIELVPQMLKGPLAPDTSVTLFGQEFASPIGIAPVGMSGLIWPGPDLVLADLARRENIPHTLSTVATTDPETVGPRVGNNGWFQLYAPRDRAIRDDLLDRVEAAGFNVLVVTADVPAPSRRERQRKAQIRVPPRIGPSLVAQTIIRPAWTAALLRNGMPRFRTVEPYLDSHSLASVAGFVGATLGGTLSWEYLDELRQRWKSTLVIKGLIDLDDIERSLAAGVDGVIVSNHGGRQLEAAPASIRVLPGVVDRVAERVPVIFDSGVRSGADVARAISLGADFVMAGRPFYYGLGALGADGAGHAFSILHEGLVNVMQQTGCAQLSDLRNRRA